MLKKTKKWFKELGKEEFLALLFGAASFKDFAKTEVGKSVVKKISSKIFGIGPKDEALIAKAINFLIFNIMELSGSEAEDKIKETSKGVEKFMRDLEKNGYSRWWFRNCLAVLRDGDAEDENQAALTLSRIILGKTFEEQVEIVGSDLVHKTYCKKISEGWKFVTDKAGNFKIIHDPSRITEAVSEGVQEAKEGFLGPFIWIRNHWIFFGGAFGSLVIIITIIFATA